MQEENVKWGWTEIAEIAPETKRWLEDFPHKSYRRLRFMLLEPEGRIEKHNDASNQRIREGRIRNIAGAINLAFYNQKIVTCVEQIQKRNFHLKIVLVSGLIMVWFMRLIIHPLKIDFISLCMVDLIKKEKS